MSGPPASLDSLLAGIRACRVCASGDRPLPHEPRPVVRASRGARIAVCGQAPGTRVHASGVPFSDPSGVRLRAWMGVTEAEFYDERRVAIVPMGFCYPGRDKNGGDLPPRAECARLWHKRVFAELPHLALVLLAGSHAHRWHLGCGKGRRARDIIEDWRSIWERQGTPRYVPLPHPSWRNSGWLNKNGWFEDELLPVLRAEVRGLLDAR